MSDHKVDLQLQKLTELLSGQPGWRKALAETLDVDIASGDLTQWEIDEAADGVDRLLLRRPETTRRLVSSEHHLLRGIRDVVMAEGMLRRMEHLGLNPVGVTAIGLLGLGCVMTVDGPFKGLTIESEATRTVDGVTVATPAMIHGNAVWDGHDDDLTLLGHVLPQSACMIAPGMRLDDLVDTPLTRELGISVRDASSCSQANTTTIRLAAGRLVAIA